MPVLVIRPATTKDSDGIWEIFHLVVQTGDTYAFAPDTSRADALAYWLSPQVQTFVAMQNDQVVGTYILRPNQPGLGRHVANASYMVHPAIQGQGIGRAMGEHSLEAARQAGYLAMQFNLVVSTNQAAVALWQKLGFRIVGTLPRAFRHQQLGYVDAHVMYQWLGEPPAAATE